MPQKLDRCVDKVKGQKGVDSAYAICTNSLKEIDDDDDDPVCRECGKPESEHGAFSDHEFNEDEEYDEEEYIGAIIILKDKETVSIGGGLSQVTIGGKKAVREAIRIHESEFVDNSEPTFESHYPMDITAGKEVPGGPDPDPTSEGGKGSGIKGHTTAGDDKDEKQGQGKFGARSGSGRTSGSQQKPQGSDASFHGDDSAVVNGLVSAMDYADNSAIDAAQQMMSDPNIANLPDQDLEILADQYNDMAFDQSSMTDQQYRITNLNMRDAFEQILQSRGGMGGDSQKGGEALGGTEIPQTEQMDQCPEFNKIHEALVRESNQRI